VIVEAARALFAERGYDNVTVSDIAERAEVGRTTYFRYFGDKQEVLFAADDGLLAEVAAAVRAPRARSVGDALPAAVDHVRRIVVAFVERLTADRAGFTQHEELVARHPELRARSVMKQRRYAELLADLLTEQGAERTTAVLAAEIGLACFYAGWATVDGDPGRLASAVDAAFARVLD
jgi:AcrR family transcriptional regulator